MTLRKILAVALIATLIVLPIVLSVPRAAVDNSTPSAGIDQARRRATAALFPFTALSIISSPDTATSTSSTGVIIPLYTYPGPTWNEVIQTKLANPSVPIRAIINPNNGPGIVQDSNYTLGIDALRSAGIIVLGYVYTHYAQRSLVSVEADIHTYQKWYNISGIFFDEMSAVIGNENYYSTLSSYVKSLGYVLTVGNPGENVPVSYIGTVNILNIYETQGLPLTSDLANWTGAYSKQNSAMMSYGVGNINSTYEASTSSYGSWIDITNAALPNPYDVLSSYFASEVAALNTAPSPALTVNLTVQSVDMEGNPISGPWTIIQAPNGSMLAAGHTPYTYPAATGSPFLVTISYGAYNFSHWSDGSTSDNMTITPTQAMTLTAYYETLNTSATTSSSSKTSTSSTTSPSSFSLSFSNGTAIAYSFGGYEIALIGGFPFVARTVRKRSEKHSEPSHGWRW